MPKKEEDRASHSPFGNVGKLESIPQEKLRALFGRFVSTQTVEELLQLKANREHEAKYVSTEARAWTEDQLSIIYAEIDRREQSDRIKSARSISADQPAAEKWEDITIRFLSDNRIEISGPGFRETRNYAEMGFEDKRKGTPNRAWAALFLLAQSGGTTEGTIAGNDFPKLEKRMQEIRKVLRKRFGIFDDPVPYIQGAGYRAKFTISVAPSFEM